MSDEQKAPHDPRGPRGKVVGIKAAIEKFRDEVTDGQIAVNLGCGQTHMDGFTNVDFMPDKAVDLSFNLFEPNWPLADGSVGFVHMSNFLEHVPGWLCAGCSAAGKQHPWAVLWNELWRVCSEGARIMVISPHGNSNRHLQDPTHCQPIVPEKFLYLNKSWREANGLNHGYYGCKDLNFLQDIRMWKNWNARLFGRGDDAKESAEKCEINAIDDVVVFLMKFASDAAMEAYTRQIEARMNGQEEQGKPIEV